MKDELTRELCMIFQKNDCYDEQIYNELVIVLSKYDVQKKTTELAIYDSEDYNEKIIKEFVTNKIVAGMTKRTVQHYTNTMNAISNKIDKPLNTVKSDDIKLYMAIRQTRDKVSVTTISNEWHVLSSFFSWMMVEEKISKNPMYKVPAPKKRKMKKKAFSQMEIEMLRANCEDNREKALLEVMFSTWCRVAEISQMNIADIVDDKMSVIGKGQKERIVYLNSKALLAIKNYMEERIDDNPALFVTKDKPHERLSISGIEIKMRELGKRAGVEKTHPHRFRRTGATMALRTGMPIEKVSYLLGHESVATTQIYLDINEQEVEQAHRKYVI